MPRRRLIGAIALAAVLGLPSRLAAEPSSRCPLIGAVFASGPNRLTMAHLPRDAEGSAILTLWRFTALDRRGARVSELRMVRGCANGRGPCSVWPPSRPGTGGGYHSEVITLDRDFSLATGGGAPYALILPGFREIRREFMEDHLPADLTFFTRARRVPDLDGRQVWRRVACGPAGRRDPVGARPPRGRAPA